MRMPYFSLILPIYNVAHYLRRCIDSILNEKFGDYEIILVDDGSTDESLNICNQYAGQYEKIKVVHKINGGLSSARNAGLSEATGKYIFWIDSDDWIEPDSLKKLYDSTKKEPVDIVKFNYIRRPEGKVVKSDIPHGYYDKELIRNTIYPIALERTGAINFSAWSHIYKKDFLDKFNLQFVSEREIGSEDYLFNWQAYLLADSMLVMDACLYNYDLRDGSLSQKYRKDLIAQYHKLHRMLRNYLENNNLYTRYKESYVISYVNKSLGVCINNECLTISRHSFYQRWINSRKLLANQDLKDAIREYPKDKLTTKEKIRIWLMRHKCTMLLMLLVIHGKRNK